MDQGCQTASVGGSVPVMSNARSRETRLTEEEVVEAALSLIEAEGTDRLTMRRLADELGVTPMAIYHYVSSKDQLVGMVADTVLAEIRVDGTGSWTESLLEHLTRTWEVLSRYPGLGTFLLNEPLTPGGRSGASRIQKMFEEVGFDRQTAELAYRTYHTYVYGLLAVEHRFHPAQRHPDSRRRAVEFGAQTLVKGLEAQLAELKAR